MDSLLVSSRKLAGGIEVSRGKRPDRIDHTPQQSFEAYSSLRQIYYKVVTSRSICEVHRLELARLV